MFLHHHGRVAFCTALVLMTTTTSILASSGLRGLSHGDADVATSSYYYDRLVNLNSNKAAVIVVRSDGGDSQQHHGNHHHNNDDADASRDAEVCSVVSLKPVTIPHSTV